MTKPLLSLCLPTYNRATLLLQALHAIASQGDAAFFHPVEILISNNASTDETEDTVREAQAMYPHLPLKYSRQPENVGGDRNMLSLAERASGRFVWILSDDDLLLPGALTKLLRLMLTYPDLDAYCLNAKPFRDDPMQTAPPYFALAKDTLFLDADAALQLFETMISFMSLLVFRRDAMCAEGYTDKLGTNLVVSYIFLDVLALRHGVFVTKEPFLALRAENSGGFGFFQVFVSQFARLIQHANRQGFARKATRAVLHGNLHRCLYQHTLTFKAHGAIGKLSPNWLDAVGRLLRVYGLNPFLIFVLIPLILTPRPVLNGLRFLYRVVARRPHPAGSTS